MRFYKGGENINNSVSSYKRKIVVSGNIVEVYEYDKPVLTGYTDTKKSSRGRQVVANDENKEINREKVLQRARRDLRRIINSNIDAYGVPAKFVTLTFADNVTDIKQANKEFTKFNKRLSYRLYKVKKNVLKYVCVPEFQKRGAIHYHVVYFNLPYVDSNDLADTWKNGFIKINCIDKVDNVGAYICKYMTKDNKDLAGQKCYFTSRKLKKPVEIKESEDSRETSLPISFPADTLTYENTFINDYNTILYKQYNIKKVKIER